MQGANVWYGKDRENSKYWLLRQWKRHGKDFPECSSVDDYATLALDSLNSSQGEIRKFKYAPQFWYLSDDRSNRFIVATEAGQICSMLMPSPCYHGRWHTQQYCNLFAFGTRLEEAEWVACRACGWRRPKGSAFEPFEVCDCCGYQQGYDVFLFHRLRWVRSNRLWFFPSTRPLNWSCEQHDRIISQDSSIAFPGARYEWLFSGNPPDAWRMPLSDEDLRRCPACGYLYDFYPWGPDRKDPDFSICSCCGCEWGLDDKTFAGMIFQRLEWLASGARWWALNSRHCPKPPPGWDLEEQLRSIPMQFRLNLLN